MWLLENYLHLKMQGVELSSWDLLVQNWQLPNLHLHLDWVKLNTVKNLQVLFFNPVQTFALLFFTLTNDLIALPDQKEALLVCQFSWAYG